MMNVGRAFAKKPLKKKTRTASWNWSKRSTPFWVETRLEME